MASKNPQLTGEELRVLLETGFILREASRFDDAEAVFSGCAELLPASEVPLVGLGTVFLQKGDYPKALEFCREAVRKQSSSAYARSHLGEALLFNNMIAEAKEQLESLVASENGSTYAETA